MGEHETPAQSEQALKTEGQRRINVLWEYTQAFIATVVVLTTMICAIVGFIKVRQDFPNIIAVAFGTVVGFYFGRTNHTRIGGVGSHDSEGR